MNLATNLLFILILAISQAQGVLIKQGSGRILGGVPDENSPKNTAAIFSKNVKHVCSGALIHPSWIVTSALCAKQAQDHNMRVVVGQTFTKTTYDGATKILNYYMYPTFDSSDLTDDIALLQLEKPVNEKVLKISNVDSNLSKKNCIIKGYGYYEPTSIEEFPGNITQRNVKIVDNNFCRQYPITVTNKKLCTIEAACNGDQGAPLITTETNELVGVVSIQEENIVCGFHAIPLTLYTKVVSYKQWIKSVTQIDF